MVDIFILGKPTNLEESLTCEFKDVRNQSAVKAIAQRVDEYVVAYLNEVSGSVYWGISDDRTVTGVRLSQRMRDEVRQVVGQKIAAIAPPVTANLYRMPFHQVVYHEDPQRRVEDTFVVEISVSAPAKRLLYLTGNGEAYRKTLGGVKRLSGAELHTELFAQLQDKVKASLDEIGIDRLEDTEMMPSVARRARFVRPLLKTARILWVDDNPANNLYERTFLASLGISADVALSTEEALYMTHHVKYDVIISDMTRGSNTRAGADLLHQLRAEVLPVPLLFYVGNLDAGRATPVGAFAITNRPDELIHYVFDVLERREF